MNWETCHDYCALYEVYHGHEWPLQLDGLENGPENYPALPSIQRDMRKLHPRRTLDQFMYPFLRDTTARDIDQTVSRWTSEMSNYEEVRKPDATSRLIMVDQLWCWVLDDGEFYAGSFLSTLIPLISNGSYLFSVALHTVPPPGVS
jgi:hypothetical protein